MRDTKEIFYVGIGKRKRAYDFTKSRSRIWKGIVTRTGTPKVQIVFAGLTAEQAKRKEKRLIKLLGRIDNKTGQLANMTDGGDGVFGIIISEANRIATGDRSRGEKNPSKKLENRIKISKATKMAMHRPDIRKKHIAAMSTDEFRRKTSEATKAALSCPIKRKRISDGVKSAWANKPFEKRSGANNHRSKPILMMKDGCKLGVFACGYEIERLFGIMAKRVNAVANGKRPHHKGYVFKFFLPDNQTVTRKSKNKFGCRLATYYICTHKTHTL